jgi:hypothetical protein
LRTIERINGDLKRRDRVQGLVIAITFDVDFSGDGVTSMVSPHGYNVCIAAYPANLRLSQSATR